MPITATGGAANTVIDTARCLSVTNRRLYRFGRYYQSKIDLRPDQTGLTIEVFALRDDWAVQKAFQMAYKQYLDNTKEERANLSSKQLARWEDFRIEHGLTLSVNEARPAFHDPAGSLDVLSDGEFQLSNVVDGGNILHTFTWGAGSTNKYGILEEYDRTGDTQASSSSPTATMPYSGMNLELDQVMHDNLQDDGNLPPYSATGVNSNSPWVRIAVLGSGTAGEQKLSTGFFTAPCGLILVKGYSNDAEPAALSIEVKAGDYKGVHAPSMLE